MKVFTLSPLAALLLALLVLPAQAQAPAQFTYQGYLENAGTPVSDPSATLTFRLLDSAANTVWSETHTGVAVADGLFEVILGSQTPFSGFEFVEALTLEVDYNGTSLGPRAPLGSAPYALGLHLPLTAQDAVAGTALLVNNTSAHGDGIKGETQAELGRGVFGQASSFVGANRGVYGLSSSAAGTGVYGLANTSVSGSANYGVFGKSNSATGYGIYGEAPKVGVYGEATAGSGNSYGVYGTAPKVGVYGTVTGGMSDASGVRGEAGGDGTGVYGLSNGRGASVHGHNTGAGQAGFFQIVNEGSSAHAVETTTDGGGYAVYGVNTGDGGGLYGEAGEEAFAGFFEGAVWVTGDLRVLDFIETPAIVADRGLFFDTDLQNNQNALGVSGAGAGTALHVSHLGGGGAAFRSEADFGNGLAGDFHGDVNVSGALSVSGTKNFKIDHPLDPANKYLYHFAVESSEVLNVYSGNATINAEGYAEVTLPNWFEALNTDFRYQLTPIGAPGPNLYIAEKIQGNRFEIAGGTPGMEVSWQVTGVRSDPSLRLHKRSVEEDKPPAERGTYLSPEAYGQPADSRALPNAVQHRHE